jgi:hypothetical protein
VIVFVMTVKSLARVGLVGTVPRLRAGTAVVLALVVVSGAVSLAQRPRSCGIPV